MRDKVILNLKIVAVLVVLLMLVSCATPCIAVDNHSTNNASNQFGDIFPLENVTANNTPFPLSSNTYYVPDNYEKIQWAVDNASGGDTIIVRDGTYTENIKVNESHLTIRSENESEATIVQAANLNDHAFEVTADYVNISGFMVEEAKNAGYPYFSGGLYLGA
jgi:pectin methylesterase-like acyl-CoA thioesterase